MEEETITTNEPVINENNVDDSSDSPVEQTTEATEAFTEDPIVQEEPTTETQETTEDPAAYNEIYSDQLELTNHLIAGQIFFMGLLFGALLLKIFWDRWKV